MIPSHKVTLQDIDDEFPPRKANGMEADHEANELSRMMDSESGDHSSSSVTDKEDQVRGVWGSKMEFFFAIVGYTVGVGSVWRFPVICSRNGGGAFLIPFFFFLISCGWPLYYLEVCIGQFTGKSAGLAFEFCPLLKGLGLLQMVLSLTVLWYLMMIFTYVLYFLYSSFSRELPWTHCNNDWNTDRCIAIAGIMQRGSDRNFTSNMTFPGNSSYAINSWRNGTDGNFTTFNQTLSNNMASFGLGSNYSSSAFEFWDYQVLRRSSGLEEMGSVQIHVAICLFIAWALCVAAVVKGVKVLGKVVYVTATAPYVLMTIMLIQGLTLDGAMDGIRAYLTPDFSKLLTTQVWLDAAVQVFFSLGPSWGAVITMSSYNKFHQKTFWSTSMCVATAGFTAFYNGLVVFTLLGFTAHSSGRTVMDVAAESGPGLLFVVFPTALSMMPVPQLWSALFFLMLVAVAFDSEFGMLETVTSCLIDMFPKQLLKRRELVNIAAGLAFFILEFPLTMNGGIYLFNLCDWYFSAFALLVGSFLELLAVCWIYGTDRFAQDISAMTGREASVVLRVMLSTVIPVVIVLVFILTITQFSAPSYSGIYTYSAGPIAAAIFIGFVPVIVLLTVSFMSIAQQKGSLIQRLKMSLRPSKDWIPHDEVTRELYTQKPYRYPDSVCEKLRLNTIGPKNTPLI